LVLANFTAFLLAEASACSKSHVEILLARDSIKSERLSLDRKVSLSFFRVVPEEVVLFLIFIYKPKTILSFQSGVHSVLSENLLNPSLDNVLFTNIRFCVPVADSFFKLPAGPFNSK
jgi:hypothetical protein